MGVDLRLLPLFVKDFWVAHDQLDVDRRRELWPDIAALPSNPIPKALTCYMGKSADGDPKYGERSTDPYGELLRWVKAGDLASLFEHEAVRDNWRNRAVWAFLAQLPEDWPIVLYWH